MKFEILDPAQIERFLKNLKPAGEARVIDVYLDTPEGDMFKRGIFIRVRGGRKLDFKFNKEDIAKSLGDDMQHLHCDEVSNTLPLSQEALSALNDTLRGLGLVSLSAPSLEELMARNGLAESMTIDKQRRSYEGGDFRIDIDDVLGLGEYLEIEKMTDEHGDTANIRAEMTRFLSGLQLKYIDTGYNELYWRKHNFELYLQGKYLLPEDRKQYRPPSVQT